MAAAQSRLDVATTNLANEHVQGFATQRFAAAMTAEGIAVKTTAVAGPGNAPGGTPFSNATQSMVEILLAQRNFETAQKTALAIDAVRSKEAQDVAKAGA